MKKITARENYEAIKTFVEENGGAQEWIDFITNEIGKLDKKAQKAKEKRAEKAAEADPYLDAISGAITDTPKTADDIVAELALEGLTRNKVAARIDKLEGVERVTIKGTNAEGKATKRVGYQRA